MDDLIIGVDGGGSRTRAVLANGRGEILGRGEAGTANPIQTGLVSAQQEITLAIRRAFESAQMEQQPVAAACMGIAGIQWSDDRAAMSAWAREKVSPRLLLLNDSEIVIAAGTPENWGIALVSGTGSICWGRTREGRLAIAGGWGYLIGDEGSAYSLVRDALRAVSQAADGRAEPTALLPAFMAHWGVSDARSMMSHIYEINPPNALARLAPIVVQAAMEGDETAQRLVTRAGQELAALVVAVARELQFPQVGTPLALTGGLLLSSPPSRLALSQALASADYRFDPVHEVHDATTGAVRLARETLWVSENPKGLER